MSFMGSAGAPRTRPEAGVKRAFRHWAVNATMLHYMCDEAKDFITAQRDKRKPDAGDYPWLP